MKILVVDDKPENIYLLEKLLQGNGYKTISAANGAEALAIALKDVPDMIISDILMPVMDGFSLCREWRKNEKLQNIPFIFYTATYTDPKDEEFALSLGADSFIVKPQEPDVLLNMMKETYDASQRKTTRPLPPMLVEEEAVFLKEYNEALIRKLEKKMNQIEAAEKKLREKNAALEKDVEERKLVEIALRESETKHRTLFETMLQGAVYQSADGAIIDANQSAQRIIGLTIDQMKGITSLDPRWKAIHEDGSSFSGETHPSMVALRTGKEVQNVAMGVLNPKTNGYSWINISAVPQFRAGENVPYQVYTTFEDITEQKKLQQELLQSQKMQSIGTLAGGIAHDFNNILGIILGYSTLMERGTISPERLHENLGIINSAVERGAALVRQILTFARKTDIVFKPTNAADLVQELLSMLKQTFPKVLKFEEIIDTDLPYITADHTQLHQAILNLCVNARDAMPNGGTITINVEKQTKEKLQEKFPAANRNEYVSISVTDTGLGMDEATRLRIFDPFFTTKELGKGTGLGLSVVYGVVQSHHGFIDVESKLGHGTTFRLYFPTPIDNEFIKDGASLAETFDIGGTETILLVEDEEALIEMVRLLLESKGYKVITAKDGKEAIRTYKLFKQEIDIVLTDMGLPGMTGMEVFRGLKEINSTVRVILASGFIEPDVKSELLKTGAKGFIQKPYSPDEVLRILRNVLDRK